MFQIVSLKTRFCLVIILIGILFHFIHQDRTMFSTTVTTNAGIQMPRLIYGTAWKKEATTKLVVQAILNGFRGIDTACQPKHYRYLLFVFLRTLIDNKQKRMIFDLVKILLVKHLLNFKQNTIYLVKIYLFRQNLRVLADKINRNHCPMILVHH